MNNVVSEEHRVMASRVRDILSVYEKNEDLISIGAYKSGTNPKLDFAIAKIDKINEFLCQGIQENNSYEEILDKMKEILG
jgi:flagellum-specific ATP synthase